MSITATNSMRARGHQHFEPEADLDAAEQRKLRGHLEQIDYAKYAANKEVVGRVLGTVDLAQFQRLAVGAAQARAEWIAAALAGVEKGHDTVRLGALRMAFEEQAEAYETLRRFVERGYVHFRAR
jgi:hypothetical protein